MKDGLTLTSEQINTALEQVLTDALDIFQMEEQRIAANATIMAVHIRLNDQASEALNDIELCRNCFQREEHRNHQQNSGILNPHKFSGG